MKDYTASQVRNVTVLGHSGAGKSTLIEACLYYNKQIDKFTRNNDGTSYLNFDPEEGKRGLSVYCHIAPVEWKDKKINFIDTPGYMDYEGEEITGLTVGDNALIVVDGKEGVEAGTERAWKEAVSKRKLPTIFFINKIRMRTLTRRSQSSATSSEIPLSRLKCRSSRTASPSVP